MQVGHPLPNRYLVSVSEECASVENLDHAREDNEENAVSNSSSISKVEQLEHAAPNATCEHECEPEPDL
jgi:hypothetical protein